jgi:Fe-S oxidoreductase
MRHRSIDAIATWARRYRDIRLVSPNALAYGSDGRSPRLDKVERLLRALKGNVFFGTFPSEVRPEFITEQSLDLVTTYCANTRLAFGAQSGSDRVLSALHRGHTVQDVEQAIDRCIERLTPVVDFILGLPMEEAEDQERTLHLIREIVRNGQVRVHRFLPLPGTPLRDLLPGPSSRARNDCLAGLPSRGPFPARGVAEIHFVDTR